jgi:hypothetical protein
MKIPEIEYLKHRIVGKENCVQDKHCRGMCNKSVIACHSRFLSSLCLGGNLRPAHSVAAHLTTCSILFQFFLKGTESDLRHHFNREDEIGIIKFAMTRDFESPTCFE